MALLVTSFTPRSRDSWHHRLLQVTVSNLGSLPHQDNGHTVVELCRVDTHGGERCVCVTNTDRIHLSAVDMSSPTHV